MPPLTAVIDRWSGDGSDDGGGTVITPRGTTQVVTRGTTKDWYEVAGTRYCSYEVAGTRWQGIRSGGVIHGWWRCGMGRAFDWVGRGLGGVFALVWLGDGDLAVAFEGGVVGLGGVFPLARTGMVMGTDGAYAVLAGSGLGVDYRAKQLRIWRWGGLLLREDTEAYTWLLRSFMTAHEKQPTMIVTDQDGAMKLAIEEVLTESKHRLCMWHIMQKIPAKICKEIYDETDFKERFNKIVWNMFMEPMEFEEKWSKLIEDFGLKNHKWMTKMFNLRRMWLPAYFIDSPLFGLMRTTSRSESENAFFKSFTNHGSTLVNFMMCFESAMERQRYRQEVLDFRTFDSAPKLHTKLKIEIHASKVYTRKIFLLVQKEIIEAVWACQILECKTEEGCEIVKVRDKRAAAYRTLNTEKEKEVVQQKEYVAEYKVLRSLEDGSVECTCRHFLRYCFLCRHAFCVLKNRDIEVIPEKYILRQWRRDIIPPALRRNKNRYGEKNETIEKLTNEANFVVDECLFLLGKDEGMLAKFVEQLKTIKQEVQVQVPKPPSQKTGDVIEDIYAVEKPQQNNVNNPQRAVNKGGWRGERRKSGREMTLKAKTKQIWKLRLAAATASEQGMTTATATKKATTTATAAEQGATTAAATEQASTTAIVSEEATNAS
ncbi:FAR1-related sequence 5-like protein [Tanacetum coccineum]